jgi:hypothetical protein
MYRRILTTLSLGLAALAIAVPVATAGQSQQAVIRQKLQEIGAWAVPSTAQVDVTKPVRSQQAITREKLEEIGAWAVPSPTQEVSKPLVSEKLAGLELTAPATPVASSSDGFDWNDAGIGAAVAFAAILLALGALRTTRHYRPVIH